jgi:hypothetical protein
LLGVKLYAEKDFIAAIVGEHPIMHSELTQLVKAFNALEPEEVPEEVMRKQVLNILVDLQLQLNVAEKFQVTLSKAEKDRIPVEHKDSLAKLRREGISRDAFIQFMASQKLAMKLAQDYLRTKIHVDDADVEQLRTEKLHATTQYFVKDVIFDYEEGTLTKAHADEIAVFKKAWGKKKMRKKDIPKRAEMLLFKWYKLDAFPEILRSRVASTPLKGVSIPIKADNGWHILKLVGKRVPKDMDRKQLHNELAHRKMQVEHKKWLRSLRSQVFVDIK